MNLVTVLILVPAVVTGREYYCNENQGTKCISNTTFIFCSKVYSDGPQPELACPRGHICLNNSNINTCIKDPDAQLDCSTGSTNLATYNYTRLFQCNNSQAVKCLSKNSFVYCSNPNQFFNEIYDSLKCPGGYICREGNHEPCVMDPTYFSKYCQNRTSDSTTISTSIGTSLVTISISNPDTVTTIAPFSTTSDNAVTTAKAEYSTATIINYNSTSSITTIINTGTTRRPDYTKPPKCVKNKTKFPAPSCRQYYQCERWCIFWLDLVLKNCPRNQVFSRLQSKCVSSKICID